MVKIIVPEDYVNVIILLFNVYAIILALEEKLHVKIDGGTDNIYIYFPFELNKLQFCI